MRPLLPFVVFVCVWWLIGAPSGAGVDPPESGWAGLVERAEAEHGEAGKRAAEFLLAHRPERDAGLDAEMLWSNLDLALKARAEFAWARGVPEELFLNDVLPYAVLDETRENWRPKFYEECRAIVGRCATATEAAQALNREYFKLIKVHYNTGRKSPNQSPSESIAQGRATCTGLSITLVYACRSVGIPARAAGVASWHDKRGNHTWVEVWDGAWHFTGADEYDANGLNRAWFAGDAGRAVPGDPMFAVWASSWKETGRHFPLVWDESSRVVHGVDVTARYLGQDVKDGAGKAVRHLRAWDGEQRVSAQVRVLDTHGALVGQVQTRAGTADLNDMPAVALTPDSRYAIEIEHDGRVYATALPTAAAGEETVDLRLDERWRVLSEEEAVAAVQAAWKQTGEAIAAEKAGREADTFSWNGHTMKVLEKTFGQAPEGERSLWISMHGGGGAPPEVNDQQWRNQIRLYELEEGIYVAPRAPTDTWNLWHQDHIDPLFDQLISTYIATRGVNPDKVYLMGYSAGGDGVYQVAPRMADRFAAAAMMAGHPNESQPLGLRNLPFAIFMGGKDEAYNRNKVAGEWGARLDELQQADPEGYPHRLTIYPDYAHWMQGEDREAIPWMAGHTRTPWPKRVVWRQDDVTHTRFYWLEVSPEQAAAGRQVVAAVDGQNIHIESADVDALRVHLHDELLDLDEPVRVEINGQLVFEGTVRRTREAIERSLADRRDPRAASTAQIDVIVPSP